MHDSPALEFPPIPIWTWLMMALLALAVFAVGFDQGQLLQPLLGKAAVTGNYLHELFHDGRHFMAVPCH
jgi:hypothetical protein